MSRHHHAHVAQRADRPQDCSGKEAYDGGGGGCIIANDLVIPISIHIATWLTTLLTPITNDEIGSALSEDDDVIMAYDPASVAVVGD
ncbi:hypothetical protein ABZP36_014738 [Zizania latifolia]